MNNKITKYVLKHSKHRDEELKYDFMPSLLEIIERPAHTGGKVIIYGIFSMLIAAIIWACVSKVDVVVTASGNTKPLGDINTVQSYSSGTIKGIYVNNGQYVKKGDLLMELDGASVEIDTNQIKNKIEILNLQFSLYQKLVNGEDILKINLDTYGEKNKIYVESIIEAENNYLSEMQSLKLKKSNYELDYQLAIVLKDKYSGNSAFTTELKAQNIVVQQKKMQIKQAESDISNAITKHKNDITAQMANQTQQISELNAQLNKANTITNYQYITSPIDGYINNIDVNTIGGVVTASQKLITIIPSDTPVEMECYVKNMDIADIEIGKEVEIKLDAYPYSKYGTVKGKVTYISPSSFVNKQLGAVFIVKVTIENNNEKINIISGLTGSIEIKTGKRSIMSYFLDPIIKGMQNSLKEK